MDLGEEAYDGSGKLVKIIDNTGKEVDYYQFRFELVETKQTNNMKKYTEKDLEKEFKFRCKNDSTLYTFHPSSSDFKKITWNKSSISGTAGENTYHSSSILINLNEGTWIIEEERKQIGWKVIKDFPGNERYKIGEFNHRINGSHFDTNSISEQKLKPHLYTDIFEPVYEEKKKETMKGVRVGTPEKVILVHIDGKVTWDNRPITDIIKLKKVFNYMKEDSTFFYVETNMERIWVGCKSEGTSVDIKDIENVIKTYDELKAQ